VTRGVEAWRQRVDPARFLVLRKHGTERAGTSPSIAGKRQGTFTCAGRGGRFGQVFPDGPRATRAAVLHERRGDGVSAGLK
jgi:peptide methionine sulfoxide reductase MsrB